MLSTSEKKNKLIISKSQENLKASVVSIVCVCVCVWGGGGGGGDQEG